MTTQAIIGIGTTAGVGEGQSKIGVGTLGQLFASNGAGSLPSFSAAAGLGASLVLIQQQTYADNAASVIFTSIPAYAKYLITFDNVRPKTAGANLTMQYSTDNGSTYVATNYTSGCNWNAYNSATLNNVNTTTSFIVAPNVSGGTTPGVNARGYLFNTSNNIICYSGIATFANNTGSVTSFSTATGSNTGFTSFNALKILFSSGNLMLTNAATITLYGIKES
jgi:hypothetical protein